MFHHQIFLLLFNDFLKGYGAVLTLEGEIELEALIVEGKNLAAGKLKLFLF